MHTYFVYCYHKFTWAHMDSAVMLVVTKHLVLNQVSIPKKLKRKKKIRLGGARVSLATTGKCRVNKSAFLRNRMGILLYVILAANQLFPYTIWKNLHMVNLASSAALHNTLSYTIL